MQTTSGLIVFKSDKVANRIPPLSFSAVISDYVPYCSLTDVLNWWAKFFSVIYYPFLMIKNDKWKFCTKSICCNFRKFFEIQYKCYCYCESCRCHCCLKGVESVKDISNHIDSFSTTSYLPILCRFGGCKMNSCSSSERRLRIFRMHFHVLMCTPINSGALMETTCPSSRNTKPVLRDVCGRASQKSHL